MVLKGTQCISRGQATLCDWSGAKPAYLLQQRTFDQRRLQNDTHGLEERLDRLTQEVERRIQINTLGVTTVPISRVDDLATRLNDFVLAQAVPKLDQPRVSQALGGGPLCQLFLNHVCHLPSVSYPEN